ncbi:MAG TPA: 3-hydroxy-3-methylglutaryl CoA synthase [Deltaproteobacteria bacterium]|nr:3-hydroxy-3-methylglutaryl CoA synthase [Deltaproteobacteria bacterium]
MIGIISYGGYIPLWRLSRSAISSELKGEKAIAGFDEDSVTMAVEAAVNCLGNIERKSIDGLIFCSTTTPYLEKQSASLIANALDLRRNIFTADALGCLRGGTIGLKIALDMVKAGSAKRVLVTAADCRLGAPKSNLEKDSGDGAAAFIVGDSDKPLAIIQDSYSISNEIMDMWRLNGEAFVNKEEDRWVEEEGYQKVVKEVVSGLMSKHNMMAKDFTKTVFYYPNARSLKAIADVIGLDPKQMQDSLFDKVGNTGTSYALVLLACALEDSKPGDKLLFASYGDGSDAFLIEVCNHEKNEGQGMKRFLERKKIIGDYTKYLVWRKILPVDKSRAAEIPKPSLKEMWRREDEQYRMHAGKCKACGTIQYPAQRVCTKCHTKDQFDMVRLSDKTGEVYTWTQDNGTGTIEFPIVTLVNVQGGGRVFCILTDASAEEVRVGLRVVFTFRKSYGEILPEYIWKVRPI